ncbi:19259_t:CDS:2, partial [Dentiscutata erythropus]
AQKKARVQKKRKNKESGPPQKKLQYELESEDGDEQYKGDDDKLEDTSEKVDNRLEKVGEKDEKVDVNFNIKNICESIVQEICEKLKKTTKDEISKFLNEMRSEIRENLK